MTASEVDKDMPFINEFGDDQQRVRTRHYSFGPSLQPSPYHSRSPSFRDDKHLLPHKSVSLEELRRYSIGIREAHRSETTNTFYLTNQCL
ncbi:hypothetical protein QE152_g5329 [Popillia japonica]|uniref:Uncharacterized protein n=1 Tax=Popillia japonica TaxID=7064 RepID=A0AAW1MPP5_POPJA